MKVNNVFAVGIAGLIAGALALPAGAQTYSYTRTISSYDAPDMVERVVEDPVTIERPVVIEQPSIVESPVVIKEHRHHAFHLGLFPLGRLDVF